MEFPNLPEGDLLIHCGDFTYMGFDTMSESEVSANFDWLGGESHKFKRMIGVAGNHDWGFSRDTFEPFMQLLFDDEIEFDGLRIYGTPYVPKFFDWAFMESETVLANRYAEIPEGLNILITHGPPDGILDINKHGNHCGSTSLRSRLRDMKQRPLIHCFGHIHPHNGNQPQHTEEMGIKFYNAAYVDEEYNPTNGIVVIDI